MLHRHRMCYRRRWPGMLPVWLVLITLLLNGCLGGRSQVYEVGILAGLGFFNESIDGFKTRMAELGYIEGQNIQYDIQYTDFDQAAYARVLNQFVANSVELIFVFPTEAALAAKVATQGTDIPVVFGFALTEGTDLIASVSVPGGNITGVRYPGPDVALKRFEIMRELAPTARRILIPYQRDYPTVPSQLAMLYPAAGDEITLIELPAASADELNTALQTQTTATDANMDAILLLAEPLLATPAAFRLMAHFAAEHQIPMGGMVIRADRDRAIFGVDVNIFGGGQQAASLADKIFQGTPAGSIPVLAAETRLQIDYTAAQDLGITVPAGLLHQADEVIR